MNDLDKEKRRLHRLALMLCKRESEKRKIENEIKRSNEELEKAHSVIERLRVLYASYQEQQEGIMSSVALQSIRMRGDSLLTGLEQQNGRVNLIQTDKNALVTRLQEKDVMVRKITEEIASQRRTVKNSEWQKKNQYETCRARPSNAM